MDELGEAELISAARKGAVLDAAIDGKRRVVRAALLRRCCHELHADIDPRGLRLSNAVVVGSLDLAGLMVPFPLGFDGCEFDSPLVVEGAQLFGLSVTGSSFMPGLLGNGLRVRRDLDLSRSRIIGGHFTSASTSKKAAIWLCESEVGGRLLCAGATIDGGDGRAMQADRIVVGGAIRLIHGFKAVGEVRLIGAHVKGSLDLSGAQVVSSSADAPALGLDDAAIEGNFYLVEDPDGRRPVIRGGVLMWSTRIAGRFLARNATIEARADVPESSLHGRTGSIDAALNAPRLSVGADVVLAGCEVKGRIDMSMSDLSGLSIGEGCVLHAPGHTALDLTSAEIRALLRLDEHAAVEGTIRLAGAAIHGILALHGRITDPERRSLVGASALSVDGEVYLTGLRTNGGRVSFRGATLGSLNADGAQFHNPGGYTVSLHQAVVKGSVRLVDGIRSTGLVVLNRSTIEGRLQFTGGSFTCPSPAPSNEYGHAIEAISATVRGGIDLGWKDISPSVDFTDATTTFLADDPRRWPERFIIAGLTYDRFEKPYGAAAGRIWDQSARCAWLNRQSAFDPGPYEQAARVFRQHGYVSEAEQILIAQRRHARRAGWSSTSWPRRVVTAVYATIGYGYRPSRVLWLLAILLVLVAASLEVPASRATLRATNGNGVVYTTTGPLVSSASTATSRSANPSNSARVDLCGNGEVRCFSPVLYAIDTVIPLVSLEQRSTWYPDPHLPNGILIFWWLNLATLLGWLLSSIFVLSLAKLSRSP